MTERIVFLLEDTFNRRDYQRYGIDLLRKNGFRVEVWDFTPFLNPKVLSLYRPPDPVEWEGYRVFGAREDALRALSMLAGDCFAVNFLTYKADTLQFFRILSKRDIPYGTWLFAYPTYEIVADRGLQARRAASLLRRLLDDDRPYLKIAANALLTKVPFRFLGVSPATLVMVTAEKYGTKGFPLDGTTELVWAHTLDYDIYLEGDTTPLLPGKQYGVFLDEYFPFHPDYAVMGARTPMSADEYYPPLCDFFEKVEAEYGREIVIAAAPRSEYEKHPDYFRGRQAIRNRTAQLVKEADFVILHHSAAISFAVLYRKPMIFITTDKLEANPIHGALSSFMTRFFGRPLFNIDRPGDIDLENPLTMNSRAYDDYKRFYIKKPGTPEAPFWQVFADRVKELKQQPREMVQR